MSATCPSYLQEIGLKGKKGKLNNYSSHFWLCALPLTALSGIYEYCIPILYCTFLYLYTKEEEEDGNICRCT
jgi:hypothetical protein